MLFSKLFDILQNFNVLIIVLMIFTILLQIVVAPNESLEQNILFVLLTFYSDFYEWFKIYLTNLKFI